MLIQNPDIDRKQQIIRNYDKGLLRISHLEYSNIIRELDKKIYNRAYIELTKDVNSKV